MQYFVVMIDYGRRGREAIVDPEITRREVIARVASGEYKNISFIHEIADAAVDDITAEILAEATVPEIPITGARRQLGSTDGLMVTSNSVSVEPGSTTSTWRGTSGSTSKASAARRAPLKWTSSATASAA